MEAESEPSFDVTDDEPQQEETKIEIIQLDEKGAGDEENVPEERDKWSNKLVYLMTLVGYAVGFGNVWRFPYMIRENGGLVFMIPYIIMLICVGIPTFFLELAVGQRRRKGIIFCWSDINPKLGGIGICCGMITFLIGLYYNTLLAYCIQYFFYSFWSPLPWTNCKTVSGNNSQEYTECKEYMLGRATKYYWNRKTLGVSTGIDSPGSYNWILAGFHVLSWGFIWGILLKGTKTVEAVIYFTAFFPYVVLIIFFILNLIYNPTKNWFGAWRVVKPNWHYLYLPMTWLKAGSQIFFSLGLGMGCLIIFASYNPVRNDCYRDAIVTSLINCGTSMFAALVVFPMIGGYGYRQWENCKDKMDGIFNIKLFEDEFTEKKFDIYFMPGSGLQKFSDVSDSDHHTILVYYGYGEINRDNSARYQDEQHVEVINSISQITESFHEMNVSSVLMNCSIGEAATASGGGTGFVFMGFTEAVLNLPFPNLWAVLFFFMFFFLGIDSGFGAVEGCLVAFQDVTKKKRWVSATIVCGTMTVLALLFFPFGWGTYILDLMDQWSANWTLLMVGGAECIGIAWVYGLAQIAYDVKLMTGKMPNKYILISWKFITPVILCSLIIGSIIEFIAKHAATGLSYTTFQPKKAYEQGSYSGDFMEKYPWYSITTGFVLMIVCIIWLPLQACLHKTKFNLVRAPRETYSDFPEDELRAERNMVVSKEEEHFSETEKKIMGKTSLKNLQKYRDEIISQSSL